ncbi:HMG box family protein [Histomonas meleagridis]|uniref:HMG box family protein n=1 Tax=Histomonas meleagridis TaxID=135588 RepID=UPI0035594924|nr:HMG box family protein [Histomonas meleagridis]KAH0801363.1 HMG box family protein [Histomonas meleagridis]
MDYLNQMNRNQQQTFGNYDSNVESDDNAKRPPNAFILYSQAMRDSVRQENPSLSNIEVSRILGKMWKEVPSETKLQYKQKAQQLQEDFKKNHPGYTYRKARRKKALNEILTKNGYNTIDPSFAYNPMMAYYQQGLMPNYLQTQQIPQVGDQSGQIQAQHNLGYQQQIPYPQQNIPQGYSLQQ